MSNEKDIETIMDHHAEMLKRKVESISKLANELPNDGEGECEYCGEYFKRLVKQACGKCRDKYKLD